MELGRRLLDLNGAGVAHLCLFDRTRVRAVAGSWVGFIRDARAAEVVVRDLGVVPVIARADCRLQFAAAGRTAIQISGAHLHYAAEQLQSRRLGVREALRRESQSALDDPDRRSKHRSNCLSPRLSSAPVNYFFAGRIWHFAFAETAESGRKMVVVCALRMCGCFRAGSSYD